MVVNISQGDCSMDSMIDGVCGLTSFLGVSFAKKQVEMRFVVVNGMERGEGFDVFSMIVKDLDCGK